MEPVTRAKSYLDLAATFSLIVACASVVWLTATIEFVERPPARTSAAEPLPSKPVSLDGAAVRGSTSARVGVIEFSDFECPFCRAFARESMPRLVEEYIDRGRVLMGFRHLPLESIHRNAFKAAEFGECARRQNKFWSLHDFLYTATPKLDAQPLKDVAGAAGLDEPQLAACMTGAAAEAIRRDAALARDLGIRGTPTFLFGLVEDGALRVVRRESGALSFDAVTVILNRLLAEGQRGG